MGEGARVFRFNDRNDLVAHTARLLVDRLVDLQGEGSRRVQLCVSGGPVAFDAYGLMAEIIPSTSLDRDLVEVWWSADCFVATDDDRRVSLRTLGRLAGAASPRSANTHPIPSSDDFDDPEEAAFHYAQDLSEITLDVCLLELSPTGQVAGLFPGHVVTDATVMGIADDDDGPCAACPDYVTLTPRGINAAREVWIIASGADSAESVATATAGQAAGEVAEPGVPLAAPARYLHGAQWSCWLVDEGAATLLPQHHCQL
ncbi:MAG: 6-phosphogluconolactonase [Propionibacteriaceae bacterium]|jgi:6-phosphogluconolactonase|nr:6-phosphogluconolactonase [Propionibacteriaceae bacterium]